MKTKYTFDFISEIIKNYRTGEFKLLEIIELNNSHTKIKISHIPCGREQTTNLDNIIRRDAGCKFCNSNKLDSKKITEIIEKETDYKVMVPISAVRFYAEIKHSVCDRTFKMTGSDFIYNKHRCPFCNKISPYTEDTLKEKIKSVDSSYTVLDISDIEKGCKSKINVLHDKCNTITNLIAHNFISNGQRCKLCSKNILKIRNSSSKSEFVKEFLKMNNIDFESEKTFVGLHFKRQLRIDFYIKSKNLAIEFDGKQHFKTNEHNLIFTTKNLDLQKTRDNIKNNFCKNNKIKLKRFNYLQSEDEILEELNKLFRCSTTIESIRTRVLNKQVE